MITGCQHHLDNGDSRLYTNLEMHHKSSFWHVQNRSKIDNRKPHIWIQNYFQVSCKAVNDFQFHSATRLFSAGFNAPRRIMEWNLPAADSQRSTEIFLRAWLKNWLIFRRRIEKRDGLVVFRWNLKVGSVIKTSVIAVFFAESQTAYFFPPGGDSEDFRIFLDNWWDQCRFSLEVEFFFLVLAVSTWKYEMTDSLYCSMAGRNIIREN